MKIIEGFELCSVMGKTMAVPSGALSRTFSGMIKMNEPSADVWRWIEAGKELEEIVCLYAQTYAIDANQARQEVTDLLDKMEQTGILQR